MAKRTKKPKKPAMSYTVAEIEETGIYQNLVAAVPSIKGTEAVRLTRVEIDARWTAQNKAKVNKLVDTFRAKLAALGIEGKTLNIVTVFDRHGNYYYDVRTEAGGRRHGDGELLPKGCLKGGKVLALAS